MLKQETNKNKKPCMNKWIILSLFIFGLFTFLIFMIMFRHNVKNGIWYGLLDEKKQPKGWGTLYGNNGGFYRGYIEDGKFINGKGISKYATGGIYEGEYRNDKFNGKGIYTFPSGNVYDGEWIDGYQSKGILRLATGDVYEGEFQNDIVHGEGKYTSADGAVYEGDFVDGEFQVKEENISHDEITYTCK